jgi:voltage-gated potassium channel
MVTTLREPTPFRDAIWHLLNDPQTAGYKVFAVFISVLILVSTGILTFEVMVAPTGATLVWLERLDQAILVIFLVEYLARLYVIRGWLPKTLHRRPLRTLKYFVYSRLRFILSPWGLIDLLAILPLVPALRSLRILRLLRFVRYFQFFRYASPAQAIWRAFRENRLLFYVSVAYLFGCIALASIMFFLAEFGSNSQVENLGDTIWWSIVTITTVGFGDITPVTTGGRFIGACLMFSGMFVIALFAGVISSTLVGHLLPLRLEQVRMSTLVDHVVIAGWNARASMMLAEIEREYEEELPEILVFANRDRPHGLSARYTFVQGDCTKEDEFDKVRLAYAQTLIVIASDQYPGPSGTDATTILTIFTARGYEKKTNQERSKGLHICAEILDPENASPAKIAGANEVMETARLGSSLLAHASINPGVGSIVRNLIYASGNNIYTSQLPATFLEGRRFTFREIQTRARDEFGILVVGVEHKDELQINPDPAFDVYQGDRIVYIGPQLLR